MRRVGGGPGGPAGGRLAGGPGGLGRLTAVSPTGAVALSIVDSDFRPVADGVGTVAAELPPGIYEVVARAGPVTTRRLVRLTAGADVRVDDLEAPFPAPSPAVGTSTSHEYHMELAEEATGIVEPIDPGDGVLVVILRDVRGLDGPELAPADMAEIELLDAALRPVANFARAWQAQPGAAAYRRLTVRSGGHVLRRPAGPGGQLLDQSIWIAPGWQTVVFLLRPEGGATNAWASIHMVPVGQAWTRNDPELGPSLELALWELRDPGSARTLLDDGLAESLVSRNPMLGLVAAAALLRRGRADARRALPLLRRLDALLPGHPDVAGLWAAMGEAGATGVPRIEAVEWPPMLVDLYLALVRRDADRPGTIAYGSLAEAVAAPLAVSGAWTAWRSLDQLPPPPVTTGRDGDTAEAALERITRSANRLLALRPGLPADRRVASYLAGVVDLREFDPALPPIEQLAVAEIAAGTHLPDSVTREALLRLGVLFPPGSQDEPDGDDGPEPRPGPGPGFPFGTALFGLLAVAALLLGGAVAAGIVPIPVVDWLNGGPSPTPTAVPSTAAPSATTGPTGTPPGTVTPTTPSPSIITEAPVVLDLEVPQVLEFPDTNIGGAAPQPMPIANAGTGAITIQEIVPQGQHPGDFLVTPGDCLTTLPVGGACTAEVVFQPAQPGQRAADIAVVTAELDPRLVPALGTGREGAVTFAPPTPSYLAQNIQPIVEKLVVVGQDAPVGIASIRFDGPNANEFRYVDTECLDAPLNPGDDCAINVEYDPPDGPWDELEQPRTARLLVETTGGAVYPLPLEASLSIID